MKIKVPPEHDKSVAQGVDQFGPPGLIGIGELAAQVEVVPTDERIFDQPATALGYFLILFLALYELMVVTDGKDSSQKHYRFLESSR